MPSLPAIVRPSLYLICGLLVGFLFLGEFALNTLPAVQVALLVLAAAGVAGVIGRWRRLELWPVFVAAAMIVPLMIDARVVGLPRCDVTTPGSPCFAGDRDVRGQLVTELVTLTWSLVGVLLLVTRARRGVSGPSTDN